MPDKFFYIICRDGQIIEVKNEEGKFRAAFAAMVDKGVLMLQGQGSVLNGTDISKVLRADQYDNYISSVNPREFVKDGIWRDGKEKGVLRYEKWKKEEIEGSIRIAAPVDEKPLSHEERKALLQKYKPEFLKNVKP